MQLRFVDGPIDASASLVKLAREKIAKAVGHFERRVNSVEVHVLGGRRHRHGVDKRCVIQATASGVGVIVVQSVAGDFYAAVNGAASKLERALARKLSRSSRGR